VPAREPLAVPEAGGEESEVVRGRCGTARAPRPEPAHADQQVRERRLHRPEEEEDQPPAGQVVDVAAEQVPRREADEERRRPER